MAQWQIGDIKITKVVELEAQWPFSALIPDAADVAPNIDWLKPDFVTDDGRMRLSIHALVLETPDRLIVVDTCAGNFKPRPGASALGDLETEFLEDFKTAGFDPERVDTVVCTHLHVDHVGWNTHLVDGQWVPTFPNATYLFVETEFNHWRDEPQHYGPVFEDSVQPVFDAGLAQLVESDHLIAEGIFFEPTPGHTPGHCSVRLCSGDDEAVITGDMMHHPVQIARPEICSTADSDQSAAHATRLAALERWNDGRLIIGTHFAGRTAGRLTEDEDGLRLS